MPRQIPRPPTSGQEPMLHSPTKQSVTQPPAQPSAPTKRLAAAGRWNHATKRVQENWRTRSGTQKSMDEGMMKGMMRKHLAPLCQGSSRVSKALFISKLAKLGLQQNDPRLARMVKELKDEPAVMNLDTLLDIAVHGGHVVLDAFSGELVIPNFAEFRDECSEIFVETAKLDTGTVSQWIPELERIDPSKFSVSVTTVDGQTFSFGDHTQQFSLMSVANSVTYCMAVQERGLDEVHKHVGRESSGTHTAAMVLKSVSEEERDERGCKATAIPHNPLNTAGALVCTSMLNAEYDLAARMDEYLGTWSELCSHKIGFDPAVMVSSRRAADRHTALGFMCKGAGAFPEQDVDLAKTLELYFAAASATVTTKMLASAAATLANGGVNPLTEHAVFDPEVARAALSLLLSCGMDEFSGLWAFDVGLPAKSSQSGAMMIVVPNVMGVAIYSPALNEDGLPAKGVDFAHRLVDTFAFHHLDSIGGSSSKKTPTARHHMTESEMVFAMISAAAKGDIIALQRLIASGCSVKCHDHDGRTPLHLAACEGNLEVVEYLIAQGADTSAMDRRGNRPFDDATRNKAADTSNTDTWSEICTVLSGHC